MKVLHISKYYYPYIGGVENVCKLLVENSEKYECAVLCFNSSNKGVVEKVNNILVYRVGAKITISKQALSLSYFPMMKKALNEFKPDIIHLHCANPYPAIVLLTMIPKDVKLVVHWHMDIIKQKYLYYLIQPFERALLKRANMILVTSPNYLNESKPLHDFKNKTYVFPNVINESLLQLTDGDQKKIQELKNKYKNKKIIFFIGRHIQYKGLGYLIEAEKHVKSDCVFVIGGTGPLTNDLKSSCHSKRVYFVGRLTNEELKIYHYAAYIFAFPSITKNEAFGLALVEAMYCGTPAITFTIPGSGVNWVGLNNETCLEVKNRDSIAYADAIDKLINDEILWKKLSINSIKRTKENFISKGLPEKINKLYEKL